MLSRAHSKGASYKRRANKSCRRVCLQKYIFVLTRFTFCWKVGPVILLKMSSFGSSNLSLSVVLLVQEVFETLVTSLPNNKLDPRVVMKLLPYHNPIWHCLYCIDY